MGEETTAFPNAPPAQFSQFSTYTGALDNGSLIPIAEIGVCHELHCMVLFPQHNVGAHCIR